MKSRVRAIKRAVLCAGVLVSALLSACGGGEQASTFHASRVIAFGDEFSVINSDQSKYTINALVSGTTTLDCEANPIWIQGLAAVYGVAFAQCPSTRGLQSVGLIYATNGAVVADLATQIDAQLANDGFHDGDLVTVLVGANDVVAQFAQYSTLGEEQLLSNLDAAAIELANQVNRLADLGAKVLISTIPNMGLTPFGGDRSAGSTDGNPALLSRLSTRFNDTLLVNLTNDGHKIGLIQLDEYLRAIDTATRAGRGTVANTTLPACAVALPHCTTNTLVADAVGATWLWADNRHLAPVGQAGLASLAATRAQNNPF